MLELLDGLDGGAGVVLVVDDVHWADLPSVQALVFALRRLVADPVLTLLAVREDADVELPESLRRLVSGHLGSVLRLRGLDEQDLRDLAAELGVDGFEMPARAAAALRHPGQPVARQGAAGGVPAAASGVGGGAAAAAAALVPAAGGGPLRRRAPRTPAGWSTPRRCSGPHCPLPLAATLGRGRAAAAGRRRGGPARAAAGRRRPSSRGCCRSRTRWSGPRSTTGWARPAGTRCTWPRPRLSTDEAAALRHRVAAAAEPDEQLAADLTRFADAEARRQAWQSAAAHLVDASRLSPDPRRGPAAGAARRGLDRAARRRGHRGELPGRDRVVPARAAARRGARLAGHRGRRPGDRGAAAGPRLAGSGARIRTRRRSRRSR